MKKILTAFILLFPILLHAQIDEVLKNYTGSGKVYFTNENLTLQCARFDTEAPCYIKKIKVHLTGSTGSARIRFFGLEGGGQMPVLKNDFIEPVIVQKNQTGEQIIEVEYEEPLYYANDWFWIGVDNMTSGIYLLSDNIEKELPNPHYYYQAMFADDSIGQYVAGFAYFVDVHVTYPTKTSKNILRDVTQDVGIVEEYLNTAISAADFDDDGDIDLFFNNKLYENSTGFTFKDITQQKGLINTHNPKYEGTVACQAFVDVDNDKDLDIILFGKDTSVVFINNEGMFTKKVLNLPEFKTMLYGLMLFNFADINYDGYPDLFVGQHMSKYDENGPDILPNFVFINNGNNDFVDESDRMYSNYFYTHRRTRSSQFGDYDNDGDQDLYIGNYYIEPDELFENDGTGNFKDIAGKKNLDRHDHGSQHGCGVNWFDYDNDGDLDLIVARIAHPRFIGPYDHRGTGLYRNEGPPDYNFTDLTGQYNDYPGLKTPIGFELQDYHSGCAFADVNNDGLADVLLKTYNAFRFINFYEQQPDHTFMLKSFEYGLHRIDSRRPGLVWLDYNNNGRIDLIMVNNGKIQLYKNHCKDYNNFLELDLRSTGGNYYAIGSKAFVYSGEMMFMREVSCGQDEMVQFPYRLHFGLGKINSIDSVVVWWHQNPMKKEKFEDIKVNKIYKLIEGGEIIVDVEELQQISNKLNVNVYPNPFSVSTRIEYYLEKTVDVRLSIHDIFGEEAAVLVDGIQPAGNHTNTLNADGLSAGTYYLKLQAGDEKVTGRIVLMK